MKEFDEMNQDRLMKAKHTMKKEKISELLVEYQCYFELCAKTDEAIDACLLKIKTAVKEEVEGNIWQQKTATVVLLMLQQFFQYGLKFLLMLGKVETKLYESINRETPKDMRNTVDRISLIHTNAWLSFIDKFIKRALQNKAPFETIKTTKSRFAEMFIESFAIKTSTWNSSVVIDHEFINSHMSEALLIAKGPGILKTLFGEWLKSVGLEDILSGKIRPDPELRLNMEPKPKLRLKKSKQTNDDCNKKKGKSEDLAEKSATESVVAPPPPLGVPTSIYGYQDISNELGKINQYDNGYIRLNFNLLGKYNKEIVSILEDVRSILELSNFTDIETFVENLYSLNKFVLFFGVDRKPTKDSQYKIVKGDGFCAYRVAAVIRSLQKPGQLADKQRNDLDLSNKDDIYLFMECVEYIRQQAEETKKKAEQNKASTSLPPEDDPNFKNIKASLICFEDEVNRGTRHLLNISVVKTMIEEHDKKCKAAGAFPHLPNLDEEFWPESEVFSYCRFDSPIVIHEEDLTLNEKKKMWIRPVIQIGGPLDNEAESTKVVQV